jgi:molybdopterin-guanine dinucleotide biosynthesis protein
MIILVSGGKSNVGKTTLIRVFLRIFPGRFSVVKITPSLHYGEGVITDSGVFKSEYIVVDSSTLKINKKDTSFFLNEGAKRVFWVRGEKEKLNYYLSCVLGELDGDAIVEGNSFLQLRQPDLMFFVEKEGAEAKEGAEPLKVRADFIVINIETKTFLIEGKVITANLPDVLKDISHPFRTELKKILARI